MRQVFLFVIVIGWISSSVVCTAEAEQNANDWPGFRGAERTGISADTGLLTQWPADGPKLLFQQPGAGRGYSSLAIVGNAVYTVGDAPTGADDKDEYLTCFDRNTGEVLWRAKTGPAWNSGSDDWQGSRSTPTIAGDHVYVLTAFGEVICFSTEGQEIWRRHLKDDFDGKKDDGWGYSESVLIDGDRLVCTPGGPKNTMVALNRMTGEMIWSASRAEDRGAGHASVVISEVDGTRVYVTTTGSGPMGVRADDGKLLWTYEIEQTTAVIPTPIIRDDLVFFSVGYRRGAALLRQIAGQNGDVSVEEIYPINPKLANKHGGVVLVGDYVYADSDDQGIPFCAALMTGEEQWKTRGSGRKSAAIVVADDHLYIRYANGTMTLAKASPDGLEESGSFTIPGSGDRPSWSHPVVVDGKLWLREGDSLLCYDLKAAVQ